MLAKLRPNLENKIFIIIIGSYRYLRGVEFDNEPIVTRSWL
ncbi:hypothetical protein D1BOALGB6SA_880 [Olavius sp. associated proteobacterium Delta 1]|nr:hypothetical protein D1BOALGB6SA_880 [Olavius sp. associated proteobacterium Delta 1]